jgi:hypothetical protein
MRGVGHNNNNSGGGAQSTTLTHHAAGARREALLRERLRHPEDGTPRALWPVETYIPDESAPYDACFALPLGDRAYLHFRHDADAGPAARLPPLVFAFSRRNSSVVASIKASRVSDVRATLIAPFADGGGSGAELVAEPGPRWRAADTVLSGTLQRADASVAADLFVADDVLVFRGAPCDPRAPPAARGPLLLRAILAARALPGRRVRVLPESHRLAPEMAPDAPPAPQWLPARWTPPYAVRNFQLRDMGAARPRLNLRLADWTATWDAHAAVAGSGVGGAAVAAAARAPLDLDPSRRFGGGRPPNARALLALCPVYRRPAVFALQADPDMADIYRLLCRRRQSADGHKEEDLATALAGHAADCGGGAQDEGEEEDGAAAVVVVDNDVDGARDVPPRLRAHLRFYQLALVPSFELSATLNAWFRDVPEQSRFAWTMIGAPPEQALPLALRNTDGRRVLLFECAFCRERARWVPLAPAPFSAHVAREEELVVPALA